MLKYLCFKSNIGFPRSNYENLLQYFVLLPIERIHQYLDIIFAFKVPNNILEHSPEILEQFELHFLSYLVRTTELFHVRYHKTNYGINLATPRLSRLLNELPNLDVFNMSLNVFKNSVKSILSVY